MQKNIKSVKHSVIYENGVAEESMQEFESGVKIRIYNEDKEIVFSQNYDLPFRSQPIKVYFDKYIKEYGLKKKKDDFIFVHVNSSGHNCYFTIKRANELTSQFTYRIDDSKVYRSRQIAVRYSDVESILAICSSIRLS